MNGIGTLNETARNMTRGPRGIGAYQQFAIGGPVRGDQFNSQGFGEPLNMPYGPGQGDMPYGPAQQLAYQQPQFGIGGMQQGNGINQYGQYLEQTYGDPEFDQKRDTFLQDVQQQEQQTFGGMDGEQHFGKAMVANPPQDYGFLGSINPLDLYKREQEQRESMKVAQIAQYEDMGSLANTGPALSLFASGGEAMGPPPTRGPDPQGIGYFQKFADGGPVYMQEGGEVITPDDIAGMRDKIMNDYGFDPEDVAVQEGVPPELFLRLLFKENRGRQGPKSPKGAIGLAQLMPATAKELGVDPTVPYENAVGGARYLKEKIAEFDGDVLLGLAAYNAGAGNVRKYKGVPPFAETEDYVAVILGEGYSGGTSISETIRKEQGFAPSMSYEGQENDVREEQGLVPISMASSGTAEGVGSLMRQESSAPETSLRPVLRSEESSAPETSLRPVLRGQKQTLREKYAPENFERNLLSPDAFQYFNGVSVMERDGKKQGIETLDPRGIRRINNFAMERSTMA